MRFAAQTKLGEAMGDRAGGSGRVAALLIAGGLAGVALAFASDLLAGSEPGFGVSQIVLLVVGVVGFSSGFFLLTPAGARFHAARVDPETVRLTPGQLLALGLWLGLLTALGEISLLELWRFRADPFWGPAPPVPWLTAVTQVGFFGLLAGSAGIVARRRQVKATTLSALFLCFLFLSLGLHFRQQLHPAAILVLAVGFASRASRLTLSHWGGFHRLIRRSAIPLAIVVIVVAVARPLAAWRAERQTVGQLPPPPTDAPNVLLVILDTVRAASLSLYGYERETSPGLTLRAEHGVVFERAISTASWTLPPHGSVFTGLYPYGLAADWATPLEDGPLTLAEALGARGYVSAGFVANRVYASRFTGLDRGFARYSDGALRPDELLNSVAIGQTLGDQKWLRDLVGYHESLGRKPARAVAREFLRWQETIQGRPFFAFLNFFDAHDPYLPPSEFSDRFRTASAPCDHSSINAEQERSRDELQGCVDAYDASILSLDVALEQMLGELENRGVLDNTLVIVTSDHGEEFGEKGVIQHGRSLNFASVHVPLVVLFPGVVPGGRRIREPVSLRDIPATIEDLLDPGEPSFQGASLARYWNDRDRDELPGDPGAEEAGVAAAGASEPEVGEPVLVQTSARPFLKPHNPVSRGHMHAVMEGDLYFILNGDGSAELYDITADPLGLDDLSSRPGHREAVARFRAILAPAVERYAERHQER